MPTNYEYALMSKLAYELNPARWGILTGQGWQWHDPDHAGIIILENELAYSVFRHDGNQEIVIAFRGTANINNLITDFWMAFGYPPNTYPAAILAVNQMIGQLGEAYENYTVSFTGHSLGGALATMCAIASSTAETQRGAVVFESPSLHSGFVIPAWYNRELIRTFVTAPDIVNTLNTHIGELRRLRLRPIPSISLEHAVASVWNSLSRTIVLVVTADYLYNRYFGPKPNEREGAMVVPSLAAYLLSLFIKDSRTVERYAPHLPWAIPAMQVIGTLSGGGVGAREDYSWLMARHHAMDNIVDALNPALGQVDAPLVQSWPKWWQHWFINYPIYEAKAFVPLLPSNRGMHTLFFSNENCVIEAQVESMVGYRLMEP